jgi:hypothetical protein
MNLIHASNMAKEITRNPKKIRRLINDGDASIGEIPAERMRMRQVRKMLHLAESILENETSKGTISTPQFIDASTRGNLIYF